MSLPEASMRMLKYVVMPLSLGGSSEGQGDNRRINTVAVFDHASDFSSRPCFLQPRGVKLHSCCRLRITLESEQCQARGRLRT